MKCKQIELSTMITLFNMESVNATDNPQPEIIWLQTMMI